MRVIAGLWRGRRLQGPPGHGVRPTTDRVKEAVFNLLGGRILKATVIDLCCGSGGLGIEALSRGATRVLFVDKSRAALDLTRRNLDTCGADPATWDLVARDALSFLREAGSRLGTGSWCLLADPPYETGLGEATISLVEELASQEGFCGAVVELGRHEAKGVLAGPWEERRYGRTRLAVWRPEITGGSHE